MEKNYNLIVKIEALKKFAKITKEKADEIQLYDIAGILNEGMKATMMREVSSRIEFTEEQMVLIFNELDVINA